ncbi:MAG: CDC48 family AAA ATPase [Candidatus Altiarchaeales archaeon]|nr:CDC48 family AAA ATPase [Candidatus Altiarchaeota archaeon]MBU4341091.1 CDC48 family AAA ATPase [Candidatus Altiarchaeota archaeon]MBU4406419.1 CDC48 family AAA ATPase [Candidatus Altiarchaeota archaeon]MBU4437603.1 CDC48 family AAA ATPase [Candidatus Altiarchaeota archaeon]MCG2782772.1 CDC48 family AAA ATPase [Candidatus Altiarchaeales archaeon]
MVGVKELELKVAEALHNDVGRGIVRIDENSMKKLGIVSGDIIEIIGKKNTAAIVWPSHPQDYGLDIIRMDGLIRQNSDSSLSDKVKVKKAEFSAAKKIVMAPIRHEIKFGAEFGSHLKQRLLGRPIVHGDNLSIGILGQAIPFIVATTEPKGIVQIHDVTKLEIKEKPMKVTQAPAIRYEDIGGLKEEIAKVREMIELPMKHPELFEKLGITPPKGVLLYGPPGTGKTLIAKAVASESNVYFIPLNGPEIMDKYYGESEKKLRSMFEEAQENAPSIIFIDELDSITPKREETRGEVERRVVAQLLTLMDGLTDRGDVIVIAATNRQDDIDPALRRPGRFDREIEIGVPDRDGRREVLEIHTRGMPLTKDVNLKEIAGSTHGFVGADLASLSREAAMNALKRILPKIDLEKEEIPGEILDALKVERNDFVEAMKSVGPSALREVFVEVPDVKWKDIGGLDEVKNSLKEAVEWPLKYPDAFERMGIRPSKAILLYGPPGCGKTLLAKAAANESEANFISVKGPEVLSMWVGESEKGIREIFKKAKQTAPTIILFDEIDAIAPRRRGDSGAGSHVSETVVNQILTEMDGIESLENVIVVGATNRPDILDPSLLRPGRFDSRIIVPAPDNAARLQIFKIHTKEMPLEGVDLEELTSRTKDYSGADIEAVCREAAMISLRENIKSKKVTKKHFDKALDKIKPSVSKVDLESYVESIKEADHLEGPAYG